MLSADSKINKALETAVVYAVGLPVVGLFMGGIYSVPAISLCSGREPWLSVLLSLGRDMTSIGLVHAVALLIAIVMAAATSA